MFIRSKYRGYRGTMQVAAGDFLIVAQRDTDHALRPELRAAVRYVKLEQCGHFMMGQTRIGKYPLTLSGTYGDDGLPCDVSLAVFEKMTPLPAELQQAFWEGGGHNSAGNEAEEMVKWARATFAPTFRMKTRRVR